MRSSGSSISKSTLLARTAGALLLLAPLAAAAAPADHTEADRLKSVLEDYLGHAAPGEPATVAVTPVGEDYEIAVDLDRLAAPIRAKGLDFTLGRFVSKATPKSDGNWAWRADAFEPWRWNLPEQSGRISVEGFRAEGEFSPTLGAFTRQTQKADRLRLEQTVPAKDKNPRIDVVREDRGIEFTAVAVPTAAGNGIDLTTDQAMASVTETFTFSEGQAEGVPDMEIRLEAGRTTVHGVLTGLRHTAVMGLWRHLVAHHADADFTTGQADFKARLRDLGPLFERFAYTAALDGLKVESPFGFGSTTRVDGSLDMTGVTADGSADFTTTLSGLEVHSLFLPPWTAPLIPKDLVLRGRVSGWDGAAALAAYLDKADFAAPKALSDEAAAEIGRLALPKGNVEIVFDGNRAHAATWDLTVDGRIVAGPGGASGSVTLKATGLDAAIAALSKPEAGETGNTAASQLMVAKMLAEAKDGAYSWRFEFEGEKVSLNGRVLSDGKKGAPESTPADKGKAKDGSSKKPDKKAEKKSGGKTTIDAQSGDD